MAGKKKKFFAGHPVSQTIKMGNFQLHITSDKVDKKVQVVLYMSII